MLPRWAMNSATRSAWTSSSSRNGSELRIVERTWVQGAMPPWSSAVPTIWWAKTSRARRWTCNGSRSWSRAAWTAARDSIASSDETARTSPREVRSSLWPDRPTRWIREVTCRGELYWTTWSTVPMSIPSSRVDVDVLSEHREAGTEELGQRAGVHEDERGAALVERVVDRGEAGRRLRGDV